MLIDDQNGTRETLSPPNCPLIDSPTFGDPWLLVSCPPPSSTNDLPRPTYELYNLSTRQWTQVRISSRCVGPCRAVAVGRYWVKIYTDEGVDQYGPSDYYLQSLSTGQFERDPVTPGGTVLDDLNAQSGSAPLCAPLRYPSIRDPHGSQLYPGALSFLGPYALTGPTYVTDSYPPGQGTVNALRLRRCGTTLSLFLWNGYQPSLPTSSRPVGSSRAVITTRDGRTLHGWHLLTLRRFTVRVALNSLVTPVAVTDRSIYVSTFGAHHEWVWAAKLLAGR